ncbi:MAG: S66 peptidase family protein [bacterium]
MKKPHSLKPGDEIIPVLPAGPLKHINRFHQSVKFLKKNKYKVRDFNFSPDIQHDYLCASDQKRFNEIRQAFTDPQAKIVMGIRGGYGCSRLTQLDNFFENLQKFNKIFCGFSDLTVINLKMLKAEMVSFYGPMLSSDFGEHQSKFTFNFWKKMLTSPDGYGVFQLPDNCFSMNSGKVRGILTGGCLSLIQTSLGTNWEIDTTDRIIFWEEVGEEPYRVDRMLTHLFDAGKFSKAAGVVVGNIRAESVNSDLLWEVVKERLSRLSVPILLNVPFGHIRDKITLPLGVEVEINADSRIINFVEGAVTP